MNIYDKHIEKDGKKINKTYLNYPPGDIQLCDCCDEEKGCASITLVWGDVTIMCKECLESIIKEFN